MSQIKPINLVTGHESGTIYNAYSSLGQLTCNNTHKCILYCDETEGKTSFDYSFHCGNTYECEFNCVGTKCFENGILNASNSNHLNVLSSASECLKNATIYLPNNGNATFSMTEEKSFKEMVVNAGINTQNIIINCSYGTIDECKQLTVNAETAQYLEINIGFNSELDGTPKNNAIINCPINSNYNGPQITSCIINLLNGASLKNVEINTINGIPNDVWIYTDDTGNTQLFNIKIICNNGYSFNFGNSFVNQGDCWYTNYPTKYPTNYPISFSTQYPSIQPSKLPTIIPTNNVIPTVTPSQTVPTLIPTITTSEYIMLPTVKYMELTNTTELASGHVEHISTTLFGDISWVNENNHKNIVEFDGIFIMIILAVACVCMCILLIIYKTYGKLKELKRIEKPVSNIQYKHETVNTFEVNELEMTSRASKIFNGNTDGVIDEGIENNCYDDLDNIQNIGNHTFKTTDTTNGEETNQIKHNYKQNKHAFNIKIDEEIVSIINRCDDATAK
eukprot:270598_1